MLERHLTRADTEQYVLGALSAEAAAALEAHTLECRPCALLLQQEALLEEQLHEAAEARPRLAEVIRPARWQWGRKVASAALAAAAAAVAFLLWPGPLPRPATSATGLPLGELAQPTRLVACPDATTQQACTQAAEQQGLLVQYPLGEVPRYEGPAGLPEGALAARRPAPL